MLKCGLFVPNGAGLSMTVCVGSLVVCESDCGKVKEVSDYKICLKGAICKMTQEVGVSTAIVIYKEPSNFIVAFTFTFIG